MNLQTNDFSFAPPFGSEGTVIESLGENHFVVDLGTAPGHPEWRNALQFTILQNARGNRLKLDVNFDYDRDKDMRFNSYPLSFSYDGADWRPVHWAYGESKDGWSNPHNLIFPEFIGERVFVGAQLPFVSETLESLLTKWERSPYLKITELGKSVQQRPLLKLTIADFDTLEPGTRIHYFKNEHGGEGYARWRMAGIVDWLLSEEAERFRQNHICHLVILSNPDGPANGWFRVNADGVDQNRAFFIGGPDPSKQPVEQLVYQQDVETIMNSDHPLETFWSFHTWDGPGEVMVRPGNTLKDWSSLRDLLLSLDCQGLFEPMHDFRPRFQNSTMWNEGMHERFGITTFLSEGGSTHLTKAQCLQAGELLISALAEYYC